MQIYKITNIINNKIYIGKDTKNNKDYYGSGKLIKRAIYKYGKHNFRKQILEDNINDKELLCEREKFWIKEINSKVPAGYNIANGGDGGATYSMKGRQHSKEAKYKISISTKQRFKNKNEREKISKSTIQRFKKQEEREKTSITTKLGMQSLEVKNKIKISKLGKPSPRKGQDSRKEYQCFNCGKKNKFYEFRKFCNMACRKEFLRKIRVAKYIIIKCKTCGIDFKATNQIFCSKNCQLKWIHKRNKTNGNNN